MSRSVPTSAGKLASLLYGAKSVHSISMEREIADLWNAINDLSEKVATLTLVLNDLVGVAGAAMTEGSSQNAQASRYKGIPVGTLLSGITTHKGDTSPTRYNCVVNPDGFYVGTIRYETLSAAAEAVSGTRRNGWDFWKLPDGTTAKQAFKE